MFSKQNKEKWHIKKKQLAQSYGENFSDISYSMLLLIMSLAVNYVYKMCIYCIVNYALYIFSCLRKSIP